MEIEIGRTKLRVYENGDLEKYWKLQDKWKPFKLQKNTSGHIQVYANGRLILAHRIIAMVYLGLDITDTKKEIDHINGIRNDNRIENLRIVSHQENMHNVSQAKGVCERENGNWKAYIGINGKQISKTFKTEAEAIDWRNEMKIIYHTILR